MSHQRQNITVNFINSLGEELVKLVDNVELDLLKKKSNDYKQAIKQYYLSAGEDKLSRDDIENLKELIVHHRNLISTLTDKKKKIKTDLKQLRMGNEMKQSYPKGDW